MVGAAHTDLPYDAGLSIKKVQTMPILLLKNGYKFFFYANEHEPAHIHVEKGDEYAKIDLKNLIAVKSFMKPATLKKALAITGEYQVEFQEKWNEYAAR